MVGNEDSRSEAEDKQNRLQPNLKNSVEMVPQRYTGAEI